MVPGDMIISCHVTSSQKWIQEFWQQFGSLWSKGKGVSLAAKQEMHAMCWKFGISCTIYCIDVIIKRTVLRSTQNEQKNYRTSCLSHPPPLELTFTSQRQAVVYFSLFYTPQINHLLKNFTCVNPPKPFNQDIMLKERHALMKTRRPENSHKTQMHICVHARYQISNFEI